MGEMPYEELDDKHFDEFYLRDMAEKMCLMFLLQLVNRFDAKELVKAKFVEKWLVKQLWGDIDEERQRNFAEYMQRKQNRLADICQKLQECRIGREALEKARLLPEGSSREPHSDGSNRFSIVLTVHLNNEESGELQDEGLPAEGLQPRILEQSAEEQRRRRQNRNAMVLNDGTRPFGRGDIIESDRD